MKTLLLNTVPFLLFLFPICLFAQTDKTAEQDITGLWKGSLYNDSTKKFLPYEIAISEEKGKLVGYSYTLFEDSGKKEVGVKRIKIRKKDGEVIIEDVEMISNNFSIAPPKKVRVQSILALYVSDTALEMRGRWSTNRTWEYRQLTGSLQVKRSIDFKQMALFEKLQELKLEKDLSFVKSAIKTQTDIATADKPANKNKITTEAPVQAADVDKSKPIKNPITEQGKEIAIEKNPAKTAEQTIEAAVTKKVVEQPKEIEAKIITEPVAKVEPAKPGIQPADQPIAKGTAIEKAPPIASSNPVKKTTDLIAKDSIAKNIKAADQSIAKTNVAEKTAAIATPLPVKKTTEQLSKDSIAKNIKPADQSIAKTVVAEKPAAIATPLPVKKTNEQLAKDSIAKNIKPADQSIAKTVVAEKPAAIATPLPVKKTNEQLAKDSVAKKAKPAEDLAVKPVTKPVAPDTQPIEKKKDIVAAPNVKKATAPPVIEQSKTIAPAPAAKNTVPVATVKAPAVQKDNKPATDLAKKTPIVEKPSMVIAPPVVKVNEPVKPITTTAIVSAPEQIKAEPAIAIAPVVKAAANVAERKMKNEQAVFFESDSLVLTLYDNGEVDGDTVSVLMNGQIIFAKQGLTTKANSKTIYIDKSMTDSLSMVMYAESLGSIPPNTGLLIIMDGEKRYEVRFSADLQTNAAILLRRKPTKQ